MALTLEIVWPFALSITAIRYFIRSAWPIREPMMVRERESSIRVEPGAATIEMSSHASNAFNPVARLLSGFSLPS